MPLDPDRDYDADLHVDDGETVLLNAGLLPDPTLGFYGSVRQSWRNGVRKGYIAALLLPFVAAGALYGAVSLVHDILRDWR